jgi:putative endonuclease
MYFLYILKSEKLEKYYVGISQNPELRLQYHNTIEKGFTSRYRPWKLVFKQEFESRNVAQQKENMIKKWKSKEIIRKVISKEILFAD